MPRQVNRCCEPKVLSYDLVPMSGALVLRADGQPIALVDNVLAPLSAAPALGPSVESGTASGSMLPTGLAPAAAAAVAADGNWHTTGIAGCGLRCSSSLAMAVSRSGSARTCILCGVYREC